MFIDADLFFAMLFGSERFRPYLGTLFMASAIGESSYSCMCVSILSIDRQPPSIHSICFYAYRGFSFSG